MEVKNTIKKTLTINRNSILLFFAGLSSILLFAPFNYFLLGFIIFPLLLKKTFEAKNYFLTFNTFFFFFLGFYLGNYYWISFSFLVNKNYTLFFPIIFLFIPLFFTVFSTIFLSLIYYLKKKFFSNLTSFFLCYSLLFFLHEYIRGHIIPFVDLKGLPWNLLGYSIANDFLVQIISIIGIYGLTFLIIHLFHTVIFIFYNSNILKTVTILILNSLVLLALYLFGYQHIKNNDLQIISQDKFLLLHTNFSQHHQYDQTKILANITNYITLLNNNKDHKDIIIFPEGAIPVSTEYNQNPAINYIIDNLKETNFNYFIVGSPYMRKNNHLEQYFNSLMLINNKGKIDQYYHKFNLVPFGEYIPYLKIFPRLAAQKNFTKGDELKVITIKDNIGNNISYIPLICYDGIFSGKMSRTGDFLLNVTNDIWFTRKISNFNISLGTWQHFDHIRYRSIEEGKPLIRVANYGITAVIDSFGRIIQKLDFNDKNQTITITLPEKLKHPTFFNKYRNLITYLLVIFNLIILYISFSHKFHGYLR